MADLFQPFIETDMMLSPSMWFLPKIRDRIREANKTLADSLYRFALWSSALENYFLITGKVTKAVAFLIAGGMAVSGQISVGTVLLFESLFRFFNSGIMLFFPMHFGRGRGDMR